MKKLLCFSLLLLALAASPFAAAMDALPPVPGGTQLPEIPDTSPAGRDTVDAASGAYTGRDSVSTSDIPVTPQAPVVGTPENPVVNKIFVRGGYITESEVKARLGTREGQLLDRKTLEEDFQRLYKMGRFADVQIKQEAVPGDNRINIIILLREKNIIKRVSFRGNKNKKPDKLLKLIKSQAGERFDEGQATRDARAIEEKYKEDFYYFCKVTMHPEPFEDGVRLVFDVEEGSKLWIRDIILRGNYRFTTETLQKAMQTKRTTFFTRGKLERRQLEEDLERLRMYYQSNGYLDVIITERPSQITANNTDKGWFARREAYLYLDIEEGEQYRIGSVSFKGNGLVSDNDIRAAIETMPGKIYSPVTLAEDAKLIRDIYGRAPNSRYFTKIMPERVLTEQPNVVDVVFHIEESPQIVIEDVQIVGNTTTKDSVYRRELEFFPGELIDSKKINRSKENIVNLDYVNQDTLAIDVKEGSAPDRARVVVDLEPKSTGNFSFGVGASTQEPIAGSVTLTQRNFDFQDWPESFKEFITGKSFVGAGQYASASMSMGTRSRNIGADFMNPWIFNKPVSWGFGAFWKTYEWDDFDDERLGFYTTIGRRLWTKNLQGSVTYRLEQVDMTKIKSNASQELRKEAGKNILSSLALSLTWDSRNNIFDPEKGVLAQNVYKFYGGIFGGDYDFWSNYTKLQTFYPFFTDRKDRNYVFTFRTDVGTMDTFSGAKKGHVPVYERLYAGGIGSVRGWRQNTLGPHNDGSAVGGLTSQTNSIEIFVPVYEKLVKASGFFDVGGVWPNSWSFEGGNEGGAYGGSGYRMSVGFGLHVKTPLSPMPIRVYVPIPLNAKPNDNTEYFQFTFGAQF